MKNSQSQLAKELHDQYFTPVDTAKWCYEKTAEATGWDFVGTALEPSVGAFAFVEAAQLLGLKLDWTTNDLYPQLNQSPDTVLDYPKSDFQRFDYIITNPPFGPSNTLVKSFMKKSLNLSDKVMMLLPKGVRRLGFQDAMPRTARRLFDLDLVDETFHIPGFETRQVKTCVQAWCQTDIPQPTLKSQLDLRTDIFSIWASDKEETFRHHPKHGNADGQICRWGAMGRTRKELVRSGAWQSIKLNRTDVSWENFESICKTLCFDDFKDMSSSQPAFDVPVFVHRFNTAAAACGFLRPL